MSSNVASERFSLQYHLNGEDVDVSLSLGTFGIEVKTSRKNQPQFSFSWDDVEGWLYKKTSLTVSVKDKNRSGKVTYKFKGQNLSSMYDRFLVHCLNAASVLGSEGKLAGADKLNELVERGGRLSAATKKKLSPPKSSAAGAASGIVGVEEVEFWKNPKKAGWLQCRGETVGWNNKRYIVLKDGFLFRFTKDNVTAKSEYRGYVDLSKIQDVRTHNVGSGEQPMVLVLKTAKGKELIYKSNEADIIFEWYSAIDDEVKRLLQIIARPEDDDDDDDDDMSYMSSDDDEDDIPPYRPDTSQSSNSSARKPVKPTGSEYAYKDSQRKSTSSYGDKSRYYGGYEQDDSVRRDFGDISLNSAQQQQQQRYRQDPPKNPSGSQAQPYNPIQSSTPYLPTAAYGAPGGSYTPGGGYSGSSYYSSAAAGTDSARFSAPPSSVQWQQPRPQAQAQQPSFPSCLSPQLSSAYAAPAPQSSSTYAPQQQPAFPGYYPQQPQQPAANRPYGQQQPAPYPSSQAATPPQQQPPYAPPSSAPQQQSYPSHQPQHPSYPGQVSPSQLPYPSQQQPQQQPQPSYPPLQQPQSQPQQPPYSSQQPPSQQSAYPAQQQQPQRPLPYPPQQPQPTPSPYPSQQQSVPQRGPFLAQQPPSQQTSYPSQQQQPAYAPPAQQQQAPYAAQQQPQPRPQQPPQQQPPQYAPQQLPQQAAYPAAAQQQPQQAPYSTVAQQPQQQQQRPMTYPGQQPQQASSYPPQQQQQQQPQPQPQQQQAPYQQQQQQQQYGAVQLPPTTGALDASQQQYTRPPQSQPQVSGYSQAPSPLQQQPQQQQQQQQPTAAVVGYGAASAPLIDLQSSPQSGYSYPAVQLAPASLQGALSASAVSPAPAAYSVGAPNPGDAQAAPASVPAANPWQVHRTGDGKLYYYNPTTNKTQWEKPEGVNL